MNDTIDQFYRDHYPRLVATASILSSNGLIDPEDIVQESFLRAMAGWDTYNPDMKLSKWFNGIMHSATKDLVRKEKKQYMPPYRTMEEDGPEFVSLEELHEHLQPMDHVESIDDIKEMMFREPMDIRTVLELSMLKQMPSENVAWVTGYSKSNVWKITSRFREKVRNEINRPERKGKTHDPLGSARKARDSEAALVKSKRLAALRRAYMPAIRGSARVRKSTHSALRLIRGDHLVFIPIKDNPKAIEKVNNAEAKAFLKARRQTLDNLRNGKRGI